MIPLPHPRSKRVGKTPVVTWVILSINVAAFLWGITKGEAVEGKWIAHWGLVPNNLLHSALTTIPKLVTHMVLHAGWMHLLGNLWFLHIFGRPVETWLGRKRYAVFYVTCGFCAAALHVVSSPQSVAPLVGASGAISGVMGAFLRIRPHEKMRSLWVILPLDTTAWKLLGGWIAFQVFHAFSGLGERTVGTAFWAHVGGFAVGFCWLSVLMADRARRTRGT